MNQYWRIFFSRYVCNIVKIVQESSRSPQRKFLVLFLISIVTSHATSGADWPQWGGPGRNFQVSGVKLADAWPEEGLGQVWQRALGDGYSSIVAADHRLFTMFRENDQETVCALAADTGKTIWRYDYLAPFLEETDVEQFGPGPLSTPLIVEKRLYAVGVTGILHCLDLESGKLLWSHQLVRDLQGTNLYRGYSASPIAYRDSVILPVGGPGRAVVAFHQQDGKILWQKQDFAISHVSPILFRLEDQNQLVVVGEKVVVGLDPGTGESYWQMAHPILGGHIASTPIIGADGRLFYSGAYGAGSRCIQLTQTNKRSIATELWQNSHLRIHHSNSIRVGDFIYGSSGDFAAIVWMALDAHTGKVVWRDRQVGRASCLYAAGKFILLQEDGTLMLAKMSAAGLQIQSMFRLFDERAWTAPTLVGNRLYARNRHEIVAIELP